MPIEAKFSVSGYYLGKLSQRCDACRWWQSGHAREVIECPLCGKPLSRRKSLTFGGVSLYFDGQRVCLSAPYNRCGLVVDEADLPDTIHFLCSLIDDWRSAERWQPGSIRSGVGDMPDPRHWEHPPLDSPPARDSRSKP